MFKFLKEALNELNTPPPTNSPQGQRGASPLRQSFSPDPASRSSRPSFSANQNVPYNTRSSFSSRQPPPPPKDPETIRKEEIAALKPTAEDQKIEGMIKQLKSILRRRKIPSEVEEVIEILDRLHTQLARHVPAAQGIFRLSDGFSAVHRILKALSSLPPEDNDQEEEFEADGVGKELEMSRRGRSRPIMEQEDESLVIVERPDHPAENNKQVPSSVAKSSGNHIPSDSDSRSLSPSPIPMSDPSPSTETTPPMDPARKYLAIKLCFYVLDAALCNESNRRWFKGEDGGGWAGFEPVIRELSKVVEGERDDEKEEMEGEDSSLPNLEILGTLFSTAFGKDETLQAVFVRYLAKTEQEEVLPPWPNPLPISTSLDLTHPTLLPILFSCLTFPYWIESDTSQGKTPATAFMTPSQVALEHLVWRIMLIALQSSWINLFQVQQHLPTIFEGILDRLYPPQEVKPPEWAILREEKRRQGTSFDATAWTESQKQSQTLAPPENDNGSASSGSRYPSSTRMVGPEFSSDSAAAANFDFREKAEQPLRAILFRILRRLVEAGIPSHYSHKLFRLAKLDQEGPRPSLSAIATPKPDESSPSKGMPRKTPMRAPSLHLDLGDDFQTKHNPNLEQIQQLDGDILDIIRHGMTKRWPDMFCFSPRVGGTAGGLFMPEMGRQWPSAQKGYHFMTWIYIEQLSQPITLLHLYDTNQTTLRIRILPNSQIGILTSSPEQEGEGSETIFSEADAMIPHRRWVHLGIGARKSKSQSLADVKLLINGKRCGTMRLLYPRPPDKVESRVMIGKDGRYVKETDGMDYRAIERSTFFLGPCMLIGDYLPDDLALLVHHLGPRYSSNLQEPLGKFLTYEAATALNIYLANMAVNPKDAGRPVLPNNSFLIRGIKDGKLVAEETIIFSYSACNTHQQSQSKKPHQRSSISNRVHNAAFPSPIKPQEPLSASASLGGDVFPVQPSCLDNAMSIVGGPVVALRMIELSSTSKELLQSVLILWEGLRESWSASEDMERMRGYDLLAGLLKLKMRRLVDVPVANAIFSTLGIASEKPERAAIHNSTAYKTLTRFDLWSTAPLDVLEVFFEQFHSLLKSKHKRFNMMKYFKKSGLVRRILWALRAELFQPQAIPLVLDTLSLILTENWSADEAIKPVFAFLVAMLCDVAGPASNSFSPDLNPKGGQNTAGLILGMLPLIVQDSARLAKLMGTLPAQRIIVVFLTCNMSVSVALPCMQLVELCLASPSGTGFEKKLEAEGGFALMSRNLPACWNEDIQNLVFRILLGNDEDGASLKCSSLVSTVFATFQRLLQGVSDDLDLLKSPRSGLLRSRSARSQSYSSLPAMIVPPTVPADDEMLPRLLVKMADTYSRSAAFRGCFDNKRLEGLIPAIADFLSITGNPSHYTERVAQSRQRLSRLMEMWHENDRLANMLRTQLAALLEQIRVTDLSLSPVLAASSSALSASFLGSSPSSAPRLSALTPASPGIPPRRPRTAERHASGGATARAKNMFERRIPLLRQFTGEGLLAERKDKLIAWRDSIVQVEAAKFIKTGTETSQFWSQVSSKDWPRQFAVVDSEAALWPAGMEEPHWRLDGTEGYQRKRLKLERAVANSGGDKSSAFHPKTHRNAIPKRDELGSAISRIGSPQDEDPFALAMGLADRNGSSLSKITEHEVSVPAAGAHSNVTDSQAEESEEEGDGLDDMTKDEVDPHKRIAQILQRGDAVEDAFNVSRVVGVDSAPGILILGRRSLYIVDGLAQNESGQIVTAQDASNDMLSIPSGNIAELDASELQSHRWLYSEIVESNRRSFLFRDVAAEFFFTDKRNFLLVFRSKKERQAVLQRISSKTDPSALKRSALGVLVADAVAKAIDKSTLELENLSSKWMRREISNFAYLQALNFLGNRTPNDATQYPIFPWVLMDYTSTTLDLQAPTTFRNLAYTMGALTPARRAAATERYEQTMLVGEKPFQFGTHSSSSMVVSSFLIRVSPWTEIFLNLQGGTFDLADRLFSSVAQAWASASKDSRGDVRELIPEFFYNPLFLTNLNQHDFGRKQATQERVDDVVLPPWALGDPLLFVHRHREALESEFVSRYLPQWIDLTFGYKQRDPAAFTCFHPLSYKDAIDLDAIDNEAEKAATIGIIHNFGQTPHQIFTNQHPKRHTVGRPTLPIDQRFGVDEHWILLIRGARALAESSHPLVSISDPLLPEHPPQALPAGRIPFGQLPASTLRYGFFDQSLRAYHGPNQLIWLSESTPVTHATFITGKTVATSAPTGVITVWRVHQSGAPYLNDGSKLTVEIVLRGHSGCVNDLVASSDWSILVSCSDDGSAIVWDTNRMRFLRKLRAWPREPIVAADVLRSEGHIALMSQTHVHIYTLNGARIASVQAGSPSLESYSMSGRTLQISTSMFSGGISFHDRDFAREGPLIAVGQDKDIVLYRLTPGFTSDEPWIIVELKRLRGPDGSVKTTAVKFMGDTLYACFETSGQRYVLYQFALPEGGARLLPESSVSACMTCGRSFGILEPRRHCMGCGGVFCSNDAIHIEGVVMNGRYCGNCRPTIMSGMAAIGASRRGSVATIRGSISSRRGSIV